MTNLRIVAIAAVSFIAMFALIAHAPASGMDGVVMQDGKMMMMKDGKPTSPMTTDVTMSDGTIVTTDGTVKRKDGTETRMRNGQMMMMDGKIMEGGKAAAMEGSDN